MEGYDMVRLGDFQSTPEDEEIVLKILRSNRLSEGRYVREFEEKWADFCGVKYCVLTNSGTSALICALEVLKDYTSQRKVLTTPLTFIATVNAIVLSGYEPDFADVEQDTFVIKPPLNTDIFLPVHLYGYPVDMDEFNYKFMIEDACEAHGTLYHGKKVGSLGLMGCFSFYVAHNITCGSDLGAVTTNSLAVYKELKKVKAHGRMCECPVCGRNEGKCPHKDKGFDPRFTFTRIAYNFKATEIQAALAINQINHAEEILKKRNDNVKYLNEGLAGCKELQLPIHDPTISYLNYPVILNPSIDRNAFLNRLTGAGVENRPLFACVPTQQPAYEYLNEKWQGRLPNAEYLGRHGFHGPVHQYLTREDLDKMIDAIKRVICEH
jgi:CDP-6-deoxy-D-xylo-4-hexulose-3-dehydrase